MFRVQPTLVILFCATVVTSAVGCGGSTSSSNPTSPSAAPPAPSTGTTTATRGPVPPILIAPADQAFFRQNDPATGCRQDPVWGYGIRVMFSWNAVPGATSYIINMFHPEASQPLVQESVTGTQFDLVRCTTVLGSPDNWKWRVSSFNTTTGAGDWSTTRTINFTECRIGNRPCGSQ